MRFTLLLFIVGSVSASAQSRAKPVVMPFALRYGQHTFGAWFGVPVTVGNTEFNLSLSTALSRSWVPGASLCAQDSNVTGCTASIGGTWGGGDAGTGTKVEEELLAGVYNNKTLSEKLIVDGKLLSQEGVGRTVNESITLKSNVGAFVLDSQSVGVVAEANKEYFPNGLLSLQQMALSLYSGGFTPSPSFHLYQGFSAYRQDSVVDLLGADYGRYVLIFGGYDRALLDLNTTQQYPLVRTLLKPEDKSKDKDENSTTAPLPASQDVGYRMEVLLEDLVYRWTEGGTTDNSLITKPILAIIDSTTPYIWVPKSVLAMLVQVSGATWNDTHKVYQFPNCIKCTEAQYNSRYALVDFKFESNDGVPITLGLMAYLNVNYVPYEGWSDDAMHMLPFRELPADGPIILGRPFLSGVHLWVDYAEKWFAMMEGAKDSRSLPTSDIVAWDRASHPPITNSSVILVKSSKDVSSSSSSSVSSHSSFKLTPPIIIGISAGGVVLLLAVCAFLFYRHFKKTERDPVGGPNPPNDHFKPYELDNSSTTPIAQAAVAYSQFHVAEVYEHALAGPHVHVTELPGLAAVPMGYRPQPPPPSPYLPQDQGAYPPAEMYTPPHNRVPELPAVSSHPLQQQGGYTKEYVNTPPLGGGVPALGSAQCLRTE